MIKEDALDYLISQLKQKDEALIKLTRINDEQSSELASVRAELPDVRAELAGVKAELATRIQLASKGMK